MNNAIHPAILRSIKRLYGSKLRALDGEIGHVSDLYFDDQQWTVRYVVADTGSWIPGRLVLISPRSIGIGSLRQEGNRLPLDLTRKQIEDSPPIESHKPVSLQYEEEYYRYYGWPAYWGPTGISGIVGFPVVPPRSLMPDEEISRGCRPDNHGDHHLRSTQEMDGYHIQTSDGKIGHVTDFIMDDENWAICHLVVETGHWFAGKQIAISPQQIDRISFEESKVFVNVTKEAILEAPEYYVPPLDGASHEAPASARTPMGHSNPFYLSKTKNKTESMNKDNSVVAIYSSHTAAEAAVKELQQSGFDMKKLSIVGRDYHTDEHVVGYYNAGDRMKYWGGVGAFWGWIWGLLFGSAFFLIPGLGPLLVAGPLVGWIVTALESAVVVGGVSAIGAGLVSLGIPENSILKYETALKTDKFVVVAHGSADEISRAKDILSDTDAETLEDHQGAHQQIAMQTS
jgi:uncharacterized protein YrrD